MIRVVVVDDERMVCTHLRTILAAAGWDVVGEAYDGAEAMDLRSTEAALLAREAGLRAQG